MVLESGGAVMSKAVENGIACLFCVVPFAMGCSTSKPADVGSEGEQCMINVLPDGGLPGSNDQCIHVGPEQHSCCSLVAAKYDVQRECQGSREVLEFAPLEPAGIGTACAWGTVEACYKKTLPDGTVEYWTTRVDYGGYEGHEEFIGVALLDNVKCQALLNSPPCSEVQ